MQEVSSKLREVLNAQTEAWGVKVVRIEIRDMRIPTDLREAMAKEAAAERERRAMVIRAKGELEAAEELNKAAQMLETSSCGFSMRYLQVLPQIAAAGNTVVFGAED
jgi:regulator of protease activity HflC (stomatin/prohibitin superfamily)